MRYIGKIGVLLLLGSAMLMTSCRSSKNLTTSTTEGAFEPKAFIKKVAQNKQSGEYVTAKVKFEINSDYTKDRSVTGNLKMKRDDVIQISIVPFGFIEAARMEFTKENMLLVDRINKRYVRVPYSKIDFFKKANLDFSTIQSLFWAELFTIGDKNVYLDTESKFTAEKLGNGDVSLVPTQEQKSLVVKFAATLATALLNKAVINGPDATEKSQFVCTYGNYTDFQGKKFPQHMHMRLDCLAKPVDLNFIITRLDNDKKWDTRTTVKDSYQEITAEQMFKKLMSL